MSVVTQDARNNTHLNWELEGITPNMLDWFWANMEKCFFLWHPTEHEEFYWEIKPEYDKVLGTIHVAPQVWGDGSRIEPHIRFEDVATLSKEITDYIIYDHAIVVGAVCLKKSDYKEGLPVLSYRIHQWEKTDSGVRGISTCIGETKEKGMVWSQHADVEVGNWEDFLPQIYKLYKAIKNTRINPFFSLKVVRDETGIRYEALKK